MTPAPDRRLVALDLDGTLVGRDGRVSDRVRRAVHAVRRRGWIVVLATGRPWATTRTLPDAYAELRGCWAVCSDGALLYGPDGVPAHRRLIDGRALSALAAELPDPVLVAEEESGAYLGTRELPADEFGGPQRVADWATVGARPVPRLFLRTAGADVADLRRRLTELGAYTPVVYRRGGHTWADLIAEGVSKARTLEVLRARLGIPPEATIAAGDSWNDVDMLRWAHLGAVVEGASPQVLAAADVVIPACADDGVAVLLETESRRPAHAAE
ncbi:HAD family hydrolase [Actinoplanes sp. NPDC051851]|uniref:HAD family hydrolase n=1 Tax=Actinoplanes sp. NPDC051851 TaxID=3154753 RepID=UPI003426972A